MSQLDSWMSALGQKRTLCGAAIDRSLLRHALPNFREQLARAVRLWHIAITSRRSRCLFFPIQRVGGDGNDRNRPHRGIGLTPTGRLEKQTHAPQRKAVYSITVSAVVSSDGGMIRPSALAVFSRSGLT